MTMRKLTPAGEIQLLKNECATVEAFMASALREAGKLTETAKTRKLTKRETRRVSELVDYIREKNAFLAKAKEIARKFYA